MDRLGVTRLGGRMQKTTDFEHQDFRIFWRWRDRFPEACMRR